MYRPRPNTSDEYWNELANWAGYKNDLETEEEIARSIMRGCSLEDAINNIEESTE